MQMIYGSAAMTLALLLTPVTLERGIVLAQGVQSPPAQSAGAAESAWYKTMFAPDLIGKRVRSGAGDDLAKIEDIALDSASGRLVAVLQSGGFMGFGGKRAVVPLAEIQKADTDFVLPQGSKEKLSGRPAYDEAKYPPVTRFSQLGTLAK